LSEPTTFQAIRKLRDVRYVVLAGTLISALAVPQWSLAWAGDGSGRIVVAQNEPKDKNKGKQPQKAPATGQQGGAQQTPRQGTQGQASEQKPVEVPSYMRRPSEY